MPPLPKPGPSDLKSKTMVCLPGFQLRPLPHRALEVEQIVEEHDLAPTDAEFALAQEQAVAAEAPALGDDHAFRATLGNLDLSRDGVGLVQNVRRSAVRHAAELSRIGELRPSRREVGPRRVPAGERRIVERQHVVLLRLGIEEVLHLLELVRHLGGKVVELGRVLLDVIELPVVPGDHVRRRAWCSAPTGGSPASSPPPIRRDRWRDCRASRSIASCAASGRRRSPCPRCRPCSRLRSGAA